MARRAKSIAPLNAMIGETPTRVRELMSTGITLDGNITATTKRHNIDDRRRRTDGTTTTVTTIEIGTGRTIDLRSAMRVATHQAQGAVLSRRTMVENQVET